MTPIEDLWRALRESPYDRGVQVVLADALIERGDPQGELIVVQVDIEAAHRHELLALRVRERELLAQLRERLLGGLPPASYKICRGVVAAVRIGHVERALDLFAERTFLEEALLAMNVDPAVVANTRAMRSLRILSLGMPKNLQPITLGMPVLDELRVMAATPTGVCELIGANPNIRKVVLDRIRWDENPDALFEVLSQITSIKLRTWVTPELMRKLVEGPIDHVEHLRVPGHEVGRAIPALVARDLPRLRDLDLRGVDQPGATRTADPMTDDGMRALAASPLRPTKLAVGVGAVTARGLRAVLASPLGAELETLIVEGVPLDASDIAALAQLPKLAEVQLLDCSLDDAVVPALGEWRSIDLSQNPAISPGSRVALEARFGGDVRFEPYPEWIEHR